MNFSDYAAYFQKETDEARELQLSQIKKIHNPYYLERFEKIARENGGYFVNNQVS